MKNVDIIPPAFDELDSTNQDGKSVQVILQNSYENVDNAEQPKNAFSVHDEAYRFPLSIIKETHGFWFELFSIAIVFSAIFFAVALYSLFRVMQIRIMEREKFEKEPMSPEAELLLGRETHKASTLEEPSSNYLRWKQIQRHMSSDNVGEWKLAIIEADIILDEIITSKGYRGAGLGEKLKQVKQEDLNSIEEAWEAHKIRNKIAHEGTAYNLTESELKRVIGLYERVFREAKFI